MDVLLGGMLAGATLYLFRRRIAQSQYPTQSLVFEHALMGDSLTPIPLHGRDHHGVHESGEINVCT